MSFVFPASQIGDAQHLHCTALNNNGVVSSQTDAAWLMRCGIVFVSQVTTSVWVRSSKLTLVQVQ